MPGRWRGPADLCLARTRRGTQCQAMKVPGGKRCRFHGGYSTGPTTEAGKRKALTNLRQYQRGWAKLPE